MFYAYLIVGHLIGARLPDVSEETEATTKPRLSLQTKTLGKKQAALTNLKDSLASSLYIMIKNKIHFNLHIIDVYNIILKEIDLRYTPQKEKKNHVQVCFIK